MSSKKKTPTPPVKNGAVRESVKKVSKTRKDENSVVVNIVESRTIVNNHG